MKPALWLGLLLLLAPVVARAEEAEQSLAQLLETANQAYDEKRWSDARDAYGKYLESIPDNLNARSDLGACLRELGELNLALEQFDRVLDQDPDHFAALYNKTLVLGLDLGRKSDAKPLLARLRKLQPRNPAVKALAKSLQGS